MCDENARWNEKSTVCYPKHSIMNNRWGEISQRLGQKNNHESIIDQYCLDVVKIKDEKVIVQRNEKKRKTTQK